MLRRSCRVLATPEAKCHSICVLYCAKPGCVLRSARHEACVTPTPALNCDKELCVSTPRSGSVCWPFCPFCVCREMYQYRELFLAVGQVMGRCRQFIILRGPVQKTGRAGSSEHLFICLFVCLYCIWLEENKKIQNSQRNNSKKCTITTDETLQWK